MTEVVYTGLLVIRLRFSFGPKKKKNCSIIKKSQNFMKMIVDQFQCAEFNEGDYFICFWLEVLFLGQMLSKKSKSSISADIWHLQ